MSPSDRKVPRGSWFVSEPRKRLYGTVWGFRKDGLAWKNRDGHIMCTPYESIGEEYSFLPPSPQRPTGYYYKDEEPTMQLPKPDPGNGVCDAKACKQPPTHYAQDPNCGTLWEVCKAHASVLAIERTDLHVNPMPHPPPTVGEPEALAEVHTATDKLTTLRGAAFVRELAELADEQKVILEELRGFEIVDQEGFTFMEEVVQESAALWKTHEDRRTSFTKPANALLREFNSWFKPALTTIKQIETVAKSKLAAYRAEQIRLQAELVARAQAQAEASGDPSQIRETLVAAAEAPPEAAGTSYIERWAFVIEDASLLPREYLKPDEAAIGAMVATKKGETNIPGVKVVKETTVRRKPKR